MNNEELTEIAYGIDGIDFYLSCRSCDKIATHCAQDLKIVIPKPEDVDDCPTLYGEWIGGCDEHPIDAIYSFWCLDGLLL